MTISTMIIINKNKFILITDTVALLGLVIFKNAVGLWLLLRFLHITVRAKHECSGVVQGVGILYFQ